MTPSSIFTAHESDAFWLNPPLAEKHEEALNIIIEDKRYIIRLHTRLAQQSAEIVRLKRLVERYEQRLDCSPKTQAAFEPVPRENPIDQALLEHHNL